MEDAVVAGGPVPARTGFLFFASGPIFERQD